MTKRSLIWKNAMSGLDALEDEATRQTCDLSELTFEAAIYTSK
jgi:hypothetical protein